MAQIIYTPGVCNIGPEEIARRRNVGWIGFLVAAVLFALLYWTRVDAWWRLFIFFPALLSASGFLQAYFHFCAGFAKRGVFNFGPLGKTQTITDEASKAKDRSRGNKIMLYAALIGAAVAIVCVLIW